MRVLTLTAFDAWKTLEKDVNGSIYQRKTDFRGELLLSCSAVRPFDMQFYDLIRDENDLNPVDWALSLDYESSVFAKSALLDVKSVKEGYWYQFGEIERLETPIKTKVSPFLWSFDLEKEERIHLYPLKDHHIRMFYEMCVGMERGEVDPTEHELNFLLKTDPRARKTRMGVLKKHKGVWRLDNHPMNWRTKFAKKFGKQYVPNLVQGQNYARGKWEENGME